MAFVRALALDELWDDDMQGLVIRGRRILLVRIAGAVHAYEDRCAHLGVALSEGKLEGCVLTCSAHHYQFDATSGQGINPKRAALTSISVRIEDGAIWVDA